jgi:putative ABC transport system permease protein
MSTMRQLIDDAHTTQKLHFLSDQQPGAISAVLAKVEDPLLSNLVAGNIRHEITGVDVVVANRIFDSLAETLRSFGVYISAFIIAVWALAVVILMTVFSSQINERKKEFAVLRILGATKKKLASIVLSESMLAALAGSLAGIIAASLVVFPFSTFIGDKFQLPFVSVSFVSVAGLAVGTVILSIVTGLCASVYSAVKISGAETYFTMREGE